MTDSRAIPGYGLVGNYDREGWAELLAQLPEEVAEDPSTAFANPALLDSLRSFVRQLCSAHGLVRLTQRAFEEATEAPISETFLKRFKQQVEVLQSATPEHPYHSISHTLEEVPERLRLLYRNLNPQATFTATQQALGECSALAHDLLHSGVGYAQRLTPGLNISNEERAVVHASSIALAAGFNPLQVLCIQRQILPTAFYQTALDLGLNADPDATFSYISGGIEQGAFPKAWVVRDYSPDAARDDAARRAAQLLALADVLVTEGSFEEWTRVAGKLFMEIRASLGAVPESAEAFCQTQCSFLRGHLHTRLTACEAILKPEFLAEQNRRILQYTARLEKAVSLCAAKPPALRAQESADAVLLAGTLSEYLRAPILPVKRSFPDLPQRAALLSEA